MDKLAYIWEDPELVYMMKMDGRRETARQVFRKGTIIASADPVPEFKEKLERNGYNVFLCMPDWLK